MAETGIAPGDSGLARRLRGALQGDVRFDAFTRGLYSTDASHYQVEPIGVVLPRSIDDVRTAMEIARESGVPVLPRGGGTSQCGQTIGRALVLDTTRWLDRVGAEGVSARGAVVDGTDGVTTAIERTPDRTPYVEVEPGVVLDHLNALLKPAGLWFPVDPSTGSRATLGGMAGNNSAGARSIRYGMMVDNVLALEAVLPDGRSVWLGEGADEDRTLPTELAALRALFAREAEEIERRTPRTMRNVAGYNLDRLHPDRENLAQLLVGSEGTLAFFSRLRLRLSPLPVRRALGVCHFPDLVSALDSVQHIVGLAPSAVELVDSHVLRLAAERPDFERAMRGFVRGRPGALLLVEFAAEDEAEADRLRDRLDALERELAARGHAGGVVRAESAAEQAAVWRVRKAGLSIVMSMAGPRKPISFIEDCAVPLEHLAEYATAVDEIFHRHDTSGTWYAHASVGCLHVRPALNLKDPDDVARIRRIAEETHEVVRRLGGTHSGEHGDGLLRSEFLESMLGSRLTRAFGEVKRTFDPDGLMNPGKIVDPPRMDDRSLFRYRPEYAERPLPVVLDWSDSGGLLGAVEKCNNNGACRKYDPDVMCPSFRVTHEERHSTRGRANALRLALTGQLGDDGLESAEMAEAMSLCISCKACRRECPTGVDMARLKLEWQYASNMRNGVPLRGRLLAGLPRVMPALGPLRRLADFAGRLPGRTLIGLSPKRPLPRLSPRPWSDDEVGPPKAEGQRSGRAVALFVDTFTRWFEPENARAALRVLRRSGHQVVALTPIGGGRPLCCGRTYLSAGMLRQARREARRLLDAAVPFARVGVPIVGLEPSCLYTLRDEVPALLPGDEARDVADQASMVIEHLATARDGGPDLDFRRPAPGAPSRVLVHGHCHQKSFGGLDPTLDVLRRIPDLTVDVVESGCCGMAGAFGYQNESFETSMAMAELDLLPAVRAAGEATRIVADGTSCRAQIMDGSGRTAVAAIRVLDEALR